MPSRAVLESRIEAQRDALFDIQALVGVCIHALPFDTPNDQPPIRWTLKIAERMLHEVPTGLELLLDEDDEAEEPQS